METYREALRDSNDDGLWVAFKLAVKTYDAWELVKKCCEKYHSRDLVHEWNQLITQTEKRIKAWEEALEQFYPISEKTRAL
jgi:hypothetical protein